MGMAGRGHRNGGDSAQAAEFSILSLILQRPNHFLPMKFKRVNYLAIICAGITGSANAATVTLNTADALGNTSFNAGGGWSDVTAPSAANDYVVPLIRLRTPADAVDHVFAGNSLKITAMGNLTFKGNSSQTITIANLILDGGLIDHLNAATQIFTLAGNLTVTGTGSRIAASQGPVDVTSVMSGSGDLAVINNLGVTFSAVNTCTGNLTVSGAFTLAGTGKMAFKIGSNGVNNTITGTSTAVFNGAFAIDLTAASTVIGDHWTLVNVATLGETFGDTFMIDGFTEFEGIWTDATGKYQFQEATGVLTVINPDSDGDGLPDSWEQAHFGGLDYAGKDDPDGDYCSNLLEYQSGTDPLDGKSFPDTDADGLNDGWELNFFKTLAYGPGEDFDNDDATNLMEYLADSDPTSAFSYPDKDADGINDGWEIRYFGPPFDNDHDLSIKACDPAQDPDGDLATNLAEFTALTDPTDPDSSPDSDGDGLPDGWEVKYFRVGTEDLAAAIAHQDGARDPDGDRLSNLLEYKAGTNPSDATSGNPTLGYWRFEEMLAGEVPAGGNGAYGFPLSITDSSPYGNPMMAWADYSRPNYVAEVPAAIVPATGAANTASLYFLRNGNDIRYFMESLFTTPANLLAPGQGFLRTITLPEYTVEASFNTPLTGVWQVPICKQGNPVAGQPPFTLKIDTTNKLRAGMVDGSGVAREIIGTTTIATGSWYSSAVTATATELKLWLKGPAETSYHLEGQLTIAGAWYVPAEGPLNTTWNIGGGQWNGVQADAFQGDIDEVRLSAVALAPEKFLFYTASTGGTFATWAEANIPDPTKRGETDDADGDGTSNLAEYRLGLNPTSGSSRFSVARSLLGALTWPSATGLTFTVQRSTSMAAGSWTSIATLAGTATTATYTDPAPPVGNAFYRILLVP